jgi:hypothetical protein
MTDTAKAKNPPVAKIRVGSVEIAIWENKTEKATNYSFTIPSRSYKGKDDKWHTTDTYFEENALELAKAADLAHTRIRELKALSE